MVPSGVKVDFYAQLQKFFRGMTHALDSHTYMLLGMC